MIIHFLRLIRLPNLLIMLATLVLSYYCMNDFLNPEDLLTRRFVYLAVATLLTGAAGYIINDYHDIKLDLVNKPGKVVIGSYISRRWAMFMHSWFNCIAVALGFMINPRVGFAIFGCAILLWLYSVSLKKQFLSGNILVAFMSAFVIIMLRFFDHHTPPVYILIYAGFAFSISLIREIIKDTEDMRGDSKFDCKTIPIVIGIRKTRYLLIALTVAFILFIMISVFFLESFVPFRHSYAAVIYYLYMFMFVIIPLGIMIYLIITADIKKDFTRLSAFAKLIMLTGMLSLVLLRL